MLKLLVLVALAAPLPAAATSILVVSRDTSLTYDVGGGAGAAVDRLRILDGTTDLANWGFEQSYTAFDSGSQGAGTASGQLVVNETITSTPDGLLIELTRSSTGTAQWLGGTGSGFATLLNNTSIVFDVIGTVEYELNVFLVEGANGPYQGNLRFQNTDPAVPSILSASAPLVPTLLTGTLTTGTYQLSASMNGFVAATPSNPSPPGADGHYGMSLLLTVPEPTTALLLTTGMIGLGCFGRVRRVHRASPAASTR